MELSAASFSYPQHEGSVRAELARRLAGGARLDEGFVLSTCLRIEVAVPGPEDELRTGLSGLFGELSVEAEPEVRFGEEAVIHLYRIASGLESPILGEQEVLTQFRQTLIEAEETGRVGGLFSRLLESAVATGRRARELLPASPHNSMAAVAAQAVGTVDRVAILGSGIMAEAVAQSLLLLPAPPDVAMVARNPEKVAQRAGVELLPFEAAIAVLQRYPAVVSATSAKHRLVDDDTLSEVLSTRENALLLIDMAMPPDFRPQAGDHLSYLSIDDLARMADRRARSEEADTLVESAALEAYRQYRDHHEVGPLIGGLMGRADDLVERVVGRFAGRLNQPEDTSLLRQAVHTTARSLLAGPVAYLNDDGRSPEAIDVIASAFGVDDE